MTPDQAFAAQLRIVHNIAVSIATERNRGNEAGVTALKPLFYANMDKLRMLASDASAADLTAWDNFILRLESGVNTALTAPATGIALALEPIKTYLLVGAVVYALFVLSPAIRAVSTRRKQ